MSSVADHYRAWFRRLPKSHAGRLAPAHAAVDAFEAIEHSDLMAEADLARLVAAAASAHTVVSQTGCNLLVRLAARHPAAQQCLLQLAKHSKAAVRFNTVYAVGLAVDEEPSLPKALQREIAERALGDRSALVRRTAIQRVEEFGLQDLLPRLEAMQRTEAAEDVQQALAKHIPLLRDGFWLSPAANGGYYLWVRLPGSLAGIDIRQRDYSEEFVRQQVARLRAQG